MRIETYLEDSARRLPDKVALVEGERRVTYRQLDELSNRLANALQARGVGRGDRIAVFLDNGLECVASVFAALKAGAAFSVVNPTTKAEKLAFILNNARAKAVVTSARLVQTTAAEAVSRAPSVGAVLVAGPAGDASIRGGEGLDGALAAASPDAPARRERGIDLDPAMILYTSGSTGHPKGVVMTHQNMRTAVESVVDYLGNAESDVVLNVLPLSFGYGLNQVLTMCRVGGTLILEKSFAFPQVVLQKLQRERVTGFALVPTIAAMLVQMKNLTPDTLPDLRYITNAAAALPVPHIQRLMELMPRTKLYSMYGQTECTRALYLDPSQLTVRPDSVGRAIPNTEVWVVNELGERAAPGEVGELVVRGGHVMSGYWENPQETAKALRPGPLPGERVLYTGDLFRTDAEGYFYFVARKDDIIKTRGEKVSPKDVENVLYQLTGVAEACVVGVPDPILGQAIKAVIVPAEGQAVALTETDVRRHCAARLEDFMVPKVVEFRQELPKTMSGKIRRKDVEPVPAIA